MIKRQKRKTKSARAAAKRANQSQDAQLLYKVAELSTVDEGSLERTINRFVKQGWTLDSVQFAMRESSRRPAMAFVMFTKEGRWEEREVADEDNRQTARARLHRLAELPPIARPAAVSAVDDVPDEALIAPEQEERWLSLETDE